MLENNSETIECVKNNVDKGNTGTRTTKWRIIVLGCLMFIIAALAVTSIVISATQHDRDTVIVATPDEATPDEATPDEVVPETEAVEPTECTTAPEVTTEPSMPVVEETKPVNTETPKTTKPTTTSTKKPSSSSNKTESNKKPSTNSTATADEPSKGKMSETEMLACVIYQEVGGSKHCDECRYRVADVVLNRVADPRFPDTIEGVLTAKNQYGRFYYTGIKWADRHTWPGEKKNVEKAWKIAKDVMAGNHSDLYGKGYVWQAGFKQGTSGFWCCGHYFAKGKA